MVNSGRQTDSGRLGAENTNRQSSVKEEDKTAQLGEFRLKILFTKKGNRLDGSMTDKENTDSEKEMKKSTQMNCNEQAAFLNKVVYLMPSADE